MTNKVLNSIRLPDGTGDIVLHDWTGDEFHDGCNLVKIYRDGQLQWRAKPPEGQRDCFVDVSFEGGNLIAHSMSSYWLVIDTQSGAIISRQFTK